MYMYIHAYTHTHTHTQLVSDEPDIEPETAKKLFTENVHRLPPQHLTENGFRLGP